MKRILYLFDQIWLAFLMISPNTYAFSRLRAKYYLRHGSRIGENTLISTNVRITGKFTLGRNSSIAQNCSISGASAGVFIGDNVMIAPSVVIVAFNHGFDNMEVPMLQQENTEKPVFIDFSQCTTLESSRAEEYLERDIRNICNFFKKITAFLC